MHSIAGEKNQIYWTHFPASQTAYSIQQKYNSHQFTLKYVGLMQAYPCSVGVGAKFDLTRDRYTIKLFSISSPFFKYRFGRLQSRLSCSDDRGDKGRVNSFSSLAVIHFRFLYQKCFWWKTQIVIIIATCLFLCCATKSMNG